MVAGCGGSGGSSVEETKPTWLTVVSETRMDGQSDDLITAGMGLAPFVGQGAAPTYVDPLKPTAAELRRAAMFSVLDVSAGSTRLFGPNIDPETKQPVADARIAGEEILAYSSEPGVNHLSAAMLLQIPASFDAAKPCILAVPATGSARLYADLMRVGGWGLRRNCAVVYTDKGQGNGVHDLATDKVLLATGEVADAKTAGTASHFTAPISDAARAAFLADNPNRIAFKHAHSRQNSDSTWGRDVVRSIQFAFYSLNQRHNGRLTRENTTVIVEGNSNGGGAALLSGEFDKDGWIDGIVAAQPQIQPEANSQVVVERGGRQWRGGGRSLIDYFTETILYQPCAALAMPDAPRAGEITFGENRCTSLKEKGMLQSTTVAEQAQEALAKLHDMGFEPDADDQHAFSFLVAPGATANKYANSQGRFGVEDKLCGYTIAASDSNGKPRAATAAEMATIFVSASGGAPVGAIDLINERDPRGPTRDSVSMSPSTNRLDYNLDGALCMRELITGNNDEAQRVQRGIAELRAKATQGGRPVIVLHGREDARVPATFSGRPYVALNSLKEGSASQVRYVEITHINHFGWPGQFDAKYVPLAYYEEQALDMMWKHLKSQAALPPNQVVRTVSRGGVPGKATQLEQSNLPAISMQPASQDLIRVDSGRIVLPD
nr:D-(-)-3-hydroxybutyrate oligomer hydrolase [Rubrivivax gelatinosus]